jgi:hypothetical protein
MAPVAARGHGVLPITASETGPPGKSAGLRDARTLPSRANFKSYGWHEVSMHSIVSCPITCGKCDPLHAWKPFSSNKISGN